MLGCQVYKKIPSFYGDKSGYDRGMYHYVVDIAIE